MLDVATLVGGLIVAKDMKPVAEIYMEEFKISKELRDAEDRRTEIQLDLDDASFALQRQRGGEIHLFGGIGFEQGK